MSSDKVSIAMLTKNSDYCLAEVLEAAKKLSSDIVVIDEYSTDNTLKICKKYGARVWEMKCDYAKEGVTRLKNAAIAKTKHEWVFQLDSDEVISPELCEEIKKVTSSIPKEAAFFIPRRDYIYLRRYLTTISHIRLFRKGKAVFEGNLHEKMTAQGNIGHLKGTLHHYSIPTVSEHLNRLNRYSTLDANSLYAKNPNMSLIMILAHMVINPLSEVFIWYFWRGVWKRGVAGFTYVVISMMFQFVKYVKYYELKNKK